MEALHDLYLVHCVISIYEHLWNPREFGNPYTDLWRSYTLLGAPVREVDSESHERFARALIIAFECQNADTPEKGIHCVALAVRNALRTLPPRTPGHQENPHGH